MISLIEQSMVKRLEQGLGQMVRTVKSYQGEVDDLGLHVKTLPAVWVSYGGSTIKNGATCKRYQDTAQFVVMVATRSLRSELSGRQGGIDKREIGSYELITAVRRLLDGQTLGLSDSFGLQPKRVQVLANNTLMQTASLSVHAVEYEIAFHSEPLSDGEFPQPCDNPQHIDYVMQQYQGAKSEPWADFKYLDAVLFDPEDKGSVPITIDLSEKEKT